MSGLWFMLGFATGILLAFLLVIAVNEPEGVIYYDEEEERYRYK